MHLRQDLSYALRMLRKTPGLTAVVVLALGLGIGANTAIFSVVNAVLLQPLPYPHPDRLVQVCREYSRGSEQLWVSIPNFLDWQRQSHSFENLAAYDEANFNLAGNNGPPERVAGYYVDTDFFQLLGVRPALGGGFRPNDDQTGRPPVAVISYRLWQSHFGGDPHVVGQTIRINDQAVSVLGVLPASFQFVGAADVFEALQPEGVSQDRGANLIHTIGRLKPGITLAAAQADMHAVGQRLARQYPKEDGDQTVGLVPLQEWWSGNVRPALLLLFGAVGLVLLIACADLANLLLAKAAGRRQEIAVRMALGAEPGRIFRQLLTESIVLALLGGALGLGIGWLAMPALTQVMPANSAFDQASIISGGMDLTVLIFTLGLAVATGVLFGLAPALQVARTDLNLTLQQEGGRGTVGHARHRLRSLLIVGELALALPLLIAAGLLMSSLLRLRATDAGFNPAHMLTAHLALATGRYHNTGDLEQLATRLMPKIRALPRVQSVALTIALPLGLCPDFPMLLSGRAPDPNDVPDAQWHPSTSQVFAAMGIPILRGRGILDNDTGSAAPVVVINQRAAQLWWPHQDPIGQSLWIGKGTMGPALTDTAPRTIVGVVGDVRQNDLAHQPSPAVYIPLAQMPPNMVPLIVHLLPLALVVRTAGPPLAPSHAVQQAVWSVDAQQPVSDLLSMDQVEAAYLAPQRFNLVLLGIFAVLAVFLAAIGIYGVMSYAVVQRIHEIGLRMAIGAEPEAVVRMVLGEGLRLALVGVGVGLALTVALTRLLSSFLFGVKSWDPATFALTAVGLVAVACAACLLPAWRASRLDPWRALRQE